MKTPTEPKLWLTPTVREKLHNYIDICPQEISGLGAVTQMLGSDNSTVGFLVTELYLLKQTVTPASTEFNPLAFDDLMARLPEPPTLTDGTSAIKLWWHSHVNMGVFWSQTDKTAIEQFNQAAFLISIVSNKAGQYLGRIDLFRPLRITFDEVTIETWTPTTEGLYTQQQAEVKELVTTEAHNTINLWDPTNVDMYFANRDTPPMLLPHNDTTPTATQGQREEFAKWRKQLKKWRREHR